MHLNTSSREQPAQTGATDGLPCSTGKAFGLALGSPDIIR
jgi:hypothetical protein